MAKKLKQPTPQTPLDQLHSIEKSIRDRVSTELWKEVTKETESLRRSFFNIDNNQSLTVVLSGTLAKPVSEGQNHAAISIPVTQVIHAIEQLNFDSYIEYRIERAIANFVTSVTTKEEKS